MSSSSGSFPLVSIVMLSFNRKEDVLHGLGRLRGISYPALETIVVDNASTDGTVESVRKRFPDVNVISLTENIGVAAANRGFFQASGEYIVIIDDDSFPTPDSIGRMVQRFVEDGNIGVVAFNVHNVTHFEQPKSVLTPTESTPSKYKQGFNGAGAGFRSSVLLQVGGYSDCFFLYWNEMDLALRVLAAGYSICWDDGIIALHKYSPTNRSSLRAPFYYTRNLYWIYWQYWPLSMLLFRTAVLSFSCIFHSIEQRSMVYIRAFIAALREVGHIRRRPLKKELIRSLRITEKLAFIYFR